jgi:hypothetical protein
VTEAIRVSKRGVAVAVNGFPSLPKPRGLGVYDIVELSREPPFFARKYADACKVMLKGVGAFADDVGNRRFPPQP